MSKPCLYCQRTFLKKGRNHKFCSSSCEKAWNSVELVCEECGLEFFRLKQKTSGGRTFCSKKCKTRDLNKNKLIKHVYIDGVECKYCSHCKVPKLLIEFSPDKRSTDRKTSWCLFCMNKHALIRIHTPEGRKKRLEYKKNRLKTNKKVYVKEALSHRITNTLKRLGQKKTARTFELLGCSWDELIRHLEGNFKEGMSWENRGIKGWHIDHILPCTSFNLTDVEEQKKCFHYTNLQPLWWYDNLKKSNKILEKDPKND